MDDQINTVAPGMKPRIFFALFSIATAAVYFVTLAGHLHPGPSAHELVCWMGLDTLSKPDHPVWGWFMSKFGAMSPGSCFMPNLFSLLCVVSSVYLLMSAAYNAVKSVAVSDDSLPFAEKAAMYAAFASGIAFAFSIPVWTASSRAEPGVFAIFLAALVVWSFVAVRCASTAAWHWLALIFCGAVTGVGLAEDTFFLPLSIVAVILLVLSERGAHRRVLPAFLVFCVCAVSAFFTVARIAAVWFVSTPAGADSTVFQVMLREWLGKGYEMRGWFGRFGWPIVFISVILPFLATVFSSRKALNNSRSWMMYAFNTFMTVCVIIALSKWTSPAGLLEQDAELKIRTGWAVTHPLPLATSLLTALSAGYLAAYWYLLFKIKPYAAEFEEPTPCQSAGKTWGLILSGILALFLLLFPVVNAFNVKCSEGRFADKCLELALGDRLDGISNIVSHGLLDDNLKMYLARKKPSVGIMSLQNGDVEIYRTELADSIGKNFGSRKSPPGNIDMLRSKLKNEGVYPFIKAWFASDPEAPKDTITFGAADTWFVAGCYPHPKAMFFGGLRETDWSKVDVKAEIADFKAFWNEMSDGLQIPRNATLRNTSDSVTRVKLNLRRHIGMVCNNLGVFVQEYAKRMGKPEADSLAFELYELVRKDIDPENICALFNEYEMARCGDQQAVGRLNEIRQAMDELVKDKERHYPYMMLSLYYGYIRNPLPFVNSGISWARTGQSGIALAHYRRAMDMVPSSAHEFYYKLMGDALMMSSDIEGARREYELALQKNKDSIPALLGLVHINIREGDFDSARETLKRIPEKAARIEWAIIYMASGDVNRAEQILRGMTSDVSGSGHSDPRAWSLLAKLSIERVYKIRNSDPKEAANLLSGVRTVIITKLESLVREKSEVKNSAADDMSRIAAQESERACLFCLNIVKGDVERCEGTTASLKKALEFYLSAYRLTAMDEIANNILAVAQELDDKELAQNHAKTILSSNPRHAYANWMIGSILLEKDRLQDAESYLREAANKALPAAQNDLAELYRREGRFEEALIQAEAVTAAAPEMYVGWDTYATILLALNRDLDKAADAIKKAIELAKKNGITDTRMSITLARVQTAQGDYLTAGTTLGMLKKDSKSFNQHDLNEYNNAVEELRQARTKKKQN